MSIPIATEPAGAGAGLEITREDDGSYTVRVSGLPWALMEHVCLTLGRWPVRPQESPAGAEPPACTPPVDTPAEPEPAPEPEPGPAGVQVLADHGVVEVTADDLVQVGRQCLDRGMQDGLLGVLREHGIGRLRDVPEAGRAEVYDQLLALLASEAPAD